MVRCFHRWGVSEVLRSKEEPARKYQLFAESVVRRAGIVDPDTEALLESAIARVPRHMFLPPECAGRALDDASLPIGFKQTSLQPSLIARMLGLLCLQPRMRVLEIGIGSGYAAAIMAEAGLFVFGTECVGPLAQQTRKRLDTIGYQNILLRRQGGLDGWAEHAPYDAILVSTPLDEVPQVLLDQLEPAGGALVGAVGAGGTQQLVLVEQQADGPSWLHLEGCRLA